VTLDDVIRARRSVRAYTPETIPPAQLEELLDLARCAPSSMNGQPWIFVVVRRPEVKAALARLKNAYCPADKREYPADFLTAAPVIVAICVAVQRAWRREIENGVLAAAFLILAAASRGLAAVYLSAYQRDAPGLAAEISQLLELPADVQPVCLVPLGYPAEPPPPKALRPLGELIRDGRF
jgi:nitroreductase